MVGDVRSWPHPQVISEMVKFMDKLQRSDVALVHLYVLYTLRGAVHCGNEGMKVVFDLKADDIQDPLQQLRPWLQYEENIEPEWDAKKTTGSQIQIRKWQHAHRAVRRNEARLGMQYDWFVRIRPDSLLADKWDVPLITNLKAGTSYFGNLENPGYGAADHFFIIHSSHANLVFNVAEQPCDVVANVLNCVAFVNDPGPECMVISTLIKNSMRFVTHPQILNNGMSALWTDVEFVPERLCSTVVRDCNASGACVKPDHRWCPRWGELGARCKTVSF